MGQQHGHKPGDHSDSNRLEWWLAGISALLIAGIIGFLVLQALHTVLNTEKSKPDPVAEVINIAPISRGYRVEIAAFNHGEATAARVKFRATLQHQGETIETAEVTFDYLPGKSKRLGAVIFMRDPRLLETDIQAESYVAP